MSGEEDKFINILLLGETGTGKSTFINSFANYMQHATLEDAENLPKCVCLIPTKFSVLTDNGDAITINFQTDDNEDETFGNSSTQATKAYVFPFGAKMIRIIDTPGINDSRGAVTKDKENFENILEYIGQLKYLHAVCFLLKPDVTVLTDAFKYCMGELLSRLDRSAADNIVFFFSRTRSSEYKAPESIGCLKRFLNEITKSKGVTIPLRFKVNERNNCFYFDNEGFNYLVAREQGVHVGQPAKLKESWENSYKSCWAFIDYILGTKEYAPLPPHNVLDTVSINRARLLIFELAKPLADIIELVQDNVNALEKHKKSIVDVKNNAVQLKRKLYLPVIELQESPLQQPATICTSAKCTQVYTIAGVQKNHFKQVCHSPCFLPGVLKEFIGDPVLFACEAMGWSTNCRKCGCNFLNHTHVYYETRAEESRLLDRSVEAQLESNEDLNKAYTECVLELEKRLEVLQKEQKTISTAMAMFAHFLQNNSICPINDSYEAYLDSLIKREKSAVNPEKDLLDRYESLKEEHIKQKRHLDVAAELAKKQNIKHVTPDQILAAFKDLKELPLTGKKIDSLHRLFVERKQSEMLKNMEYVHSLPPQPRNEDKGNDELEQMQAVILNLLSSNYQQAANALYKEFVEKKEQPPNMVKKMTDWFSNLSLP